MPITMLADGRILVLGRRRRPYEYRLIVAGGTRVDALAPDGQSFVAITDTGPRRWVATATAPARWHGSRRRGYDERVRVHADAHIVEARS